MRKPEYNRELVKLMERGNVSVTGLAKELNVSRPTAMKVLSNPHAMSFNTLKRMSKVLNVPVSQLCYIIDGPKH